MNEINTSPFITCAVTGGGAKPDHPDIPVLPKDIAKAAIEAAQEGAAIVHCHVRDPETGAGTHNVDLYREVVDRIRDNATDVVINLTGSGLGTIIVDDEKPASFLPGTNVSPARDRMSHVEALRPEIMTLDLGSLNWGDSGIYAGHPKVMRAMARRLQELGVKPELEAFDIGALMFARRLISEGVITEPPLIQLCLGVGMNAPATTHVMLAMRDILPEGAIWSAFGLGRNQIPMVAKSMLLGGNVRVGLEDNLYLERGVYASNADLVRRAREIVERLGATVLTPAQVRERLHLVKHQR
jgi:uncharacterized protein (DUF849 family)